MTSKVTDIIADCLLTAPEIALIVADDQRRIVSWGKGAERIYQLDSSAAIGRGLDELVHCPLPASPDHIEPGSYLQSSQWSEGIESLESGSEVFVETFSRTLWDDRQHLIGILALIHDITNRKRAESQFAETLARERQLRAESQQANAAKDEFLALVAHELRAPLNSILAWVHLFRRELFDPSQIADIMQSIEHSARALSKLVEDLVDVSRIVEGKLSLELRDVDISTVLEIAAHAARPVAESKGLRFDLEISPSLGTLVADPDRLEQIVSNLVTNAIKFTPSGGQVILSAERTGTAFRITVSDTGTGISPSVLHRVFEPFWQDDIRGFRKSSGLGLGLTIARRLVEMHEGRITIESLGQNKGTKVTVELPQRLVQEREAAPKVAVPSPSPSALAGLKILVVDDDQNLRNMLATTLAFYGAQVHPAATVREALDALAVLKIDVIVSDLEMPEEDGYALIQHLSEINRVVPSISLSGYSAPEAVLASAAAGYSLHLTKPVEIATLVSAITRLAGGV